MKPKKTKKELLIEQIKKEIRKQKKIKKKMLKNKVYINK